MSGIYAIRCLPSGRIYVGSAKNITARWATHRSELRSGKHHNQILQRSWDKYGEDAFVFEVLEFVAVDDLIAAEQSYIDNLNATDREVGFNINPVAGSCLGRRCTDEQRARMSEARKGRKHSPEHILAWNTAGREAARSPEARAKKSASLKGRVRSDEHRAKLSAALKGRVYSDEYRAKVSATLRARCDWKLTPEQIPEIEIFLASGVPQREIADRFGVSQATINNVKFGRHPAQRATAA